MKGVIFCSRCRGIEVGWNRYYIRHNLTCASGFFRSLRLPALTVVALAAVVLLPTGAISPVPAAVPAPDQAVVVEIVGVPEQVTTVDPSVAAIEDLLGRHTRVTPDDRLRIARAVVASGREHDVDPFLVTGILIAESSGNPYAISNRQAVGIMQIHVPTWGETAEAEGINLFLLEDSIYLGTRILRDYTRRFGLWDGVMRYLGAREATPEALAYVQRVQSIYSDRQAD